MSVIDAPASAGQGKGSPTVSPMFVSSDAVKQILQWDEMVGRLRAAYSTPLDDKVSPPRTVARGDRKLDPHPHRGAAGLALHGRQDFRHVAQPQRRLHDRADGSRDRRFRRHDRRLLRHHVPHRRHLGGGGGPAVRARAEDPGGARQRLGGQRAYPRASHDPADFGLAGVQPDRGQPRSLRRAHSSRSSASQASPWPRQRPRSTAPTSSSPAPVRAANCRSFTASGCVPA